MSFWDDLGHAVGTVGHVVETTLNPVSAITDPLLGSSNPVTTLLNPADAIFNTLTSMATPDLMVGVSVQKPDHQPGPSAAVIVQVDGVLGGGIAVSFNLPDMSFSGITVAIEVGEEFQLSGSAGYTWDL